MKVLAILSMLIFLFCSTASAAWVVKWDTVMMYLVPCPQSEPVPDEFGRVPQSMVTLAIACWETEIKPMERLFETHEAAKAFVERGKKDVTNDWKPSLENFKIYSLVVSDESNE